MKTKTLLIALLVFNVGFGHAQFLKKLKNKVSKTVEEAVSKKIEKKAKDKTEATMDSLLDAKGKKDKAKNRRGSSSEESEGDFDLDQEGMPGFMKDLNLSKMMEMSERISEAKVASSYQFDTQLSVQISNGDQSTEMEFFFGDNLLMTEVEEAPSIKLIYDYNNNSLITLDEENRTVMGLPLDFMGEMMDFMGDLRQEEVDTPQHFEKTGKKKKILGYKAEEYIAEDDTMKINFWFSEEVPLDNSRMLKGFEKLGAVFSFDFAVVDQNYKKGIMLEMTATEKTNQTTTQVNVTQLLAKRSFTVSTANYKKISSNP
jgi:hypothetical protein